MVPASDADLFLSLLEASTDNIFLIDRSGRFTHVSRGGAAAVGRSAEELIGHTWREAGLEASVMEKVEGQWNRVFREGVTIREEVAYETPHGLRTYEYLMFPVVDRVAVVARDITARVVAEEAALRANERYRGFVENSSEAIWRFELDEPIDTSLSPDEQIDLVFERGYLAEANDAMARMYGYDSAEEIVGVRLRDMLDPTVPANREFLRAVISSGYRLSGAESAELDRFGGRKYFVNSLTAIVQDGRVVRAWGTQRDVTEERSADERLRRSEQRLQTLVSASMQMIWTTDAGGRLDSVTPSWTETTGETLAETRALGWTSIVHPDDRQAFEEYCRRQLERHEVIDTETRLRMRDGSFRWYRMRMAPVLNDDDTVREWIGAATDIHLQHQHAESQAATQFRAEFMADANDLFAQSLDYEQTLRNLASMAVPRLADWCSVDMVEPDGIRRLAVEHPEPEMVKLAYELLERYPANPDALYGLPNVVRTGKTEWMAEIPDALLESTARSAEHLDLLRKLRLKSYICTAIHVGDEVAGVLTLVNGETSRRFDPIDVELAEGLALRAGHAIQNARLYQQAVEANRAKDEFLATLSHELRTPLTAILGWANLSQLSGHDQATIQTAMRMIEQSARAQAALIDDLLDVSRIITGKLQLNLATVNARTVVENGIASVRPAAEARHITIQVDAPEELRVRVDPNRVQQIVWNLMSNAVKFSGEGSQVAVALRREDDHVVLTVADHGIGIQPEMLPRVFDRFWQADSSAHRGYGGLGLGLAIVKYLAEMHGGSASVASEGRGKGTTFTVRLPVGDVAQSVTREKELPPANARRVLLVDDDPSAREVVRRTLEHFGARVIAAASANEALVLADAEVFDLVLTDIAMPERDGYWLL